MCLRSRAVACLVVLLLQVLNVDDLHRFCLGFCSVELLNSRCLIWPLFALIRATIVSIVASSCAIWTDVWARAGKVSTHVLIKVLRVTQAINILLLLSLCSSCSRLIDFADDYFILIWGRSRPAVAFRPSFILNTAPFIIAIVATSGSVSWLFSPVVFEDQLVLNRGFEPVILGLAAELVIFVVGSGCWAWWRGTFARWASLVFITHLALSILGIRVGCVLHSSFIVVTALCSLIITIASVNAGRHWRAASSLIALVAHLCILFEEQVVSCGQVIVLVVFNCALNAVDAEAQRGFHFHHQFVIHRPSLSMVPIVLVLRLVELIPGVLLESVNIDAFVWICHENLW